MPIAVGDCKMHLGRGISAGVAVLGVFLLIIGLALCFMPVHEHKVVYELTTYPDRDIGFMVSIVGVIIGVLGFIGLFSCDDRERKGLAPVSSNEERS